MILYHFTHPNNFPSIMRDGLVPSDWRLANQSIDRACVWLFDTPETRDYMDDRSTVSRSASSEIRWSTMLSTAALIPG